MLIDTHCHVDRFPDPFALTMECEKQETFTVAVTNLPGHYEIAQEHLSTANFVKPALGFHPLAVADNLEELPLFHSLLPSAKFIGEVGLDYSKQGVTSKDAQLRVFRSIAKALAPLPRFVTLHSRKSASDVLAILNEFEISCAVFHWYSDSMSVLQKVVDAGHYFSINSAMLLSKSGQAIIDSVPRNRILTETDGPYVKVGRSRAKPSDVRVVLSGIASRWDTDVDSVQSQVTENFKSLCERLSIRLPDSKDTAF